MAAVITNGRGEVLLIKRRDNGQWQIPGGVLELGESIHGALIREIHEETGLAIEPGVLTGVYKNMTLGVVALVFRARVVGGVPTPTLETVDFQWCSPDRVCLLTTEAFAIRVTDALTFSRPAAVRIHDGAQILPDIEPNLL